jgi:hypothetical protein
LTLKVQVEDELSAAATKRGQVVEEQSMFQEGASVSLDVMAQDDADLETQAGVHTREGTALQHACAALASVAEVLFCSILPPSAVLTRFKCMLQSAGHGTNLDVWTLRILLCILRIFWGRAANNNSVAYLSTQYR